MNEGREANGTYVGENDARTTWSASLGMRGKVDKKARMKANSLMERGRSCCSDVKEKYACPRGRGGVYIQKRDKG